jgi:Ca2+-binding EF-hand superfamily protein
MKTIILAGAMAAAAAVPAFAQPPAPMAPMGPQAPRAGLERGHMARPVTRAEVQARVQRMFARFDLNRDGFITRDEIAAARAQRAGGHRFQGQDMRAQPVQGDRAAMRAPARRGERLFARLDANHDGVITRAEFDAAMAARQQHMGARGGRGEGFRGGARFGRAGMGGFGGRLFERFDMDRDGRVSIQEATSAALQAFDRADTNHDGVVTPEERRAARAGMGARRL